MTVFIELLLLLILARGLGELAERRVARGNDRHDLGERRVAHPGAPVGPGDADAPEPALGKRVDLRKGQPALPVALRGLLGKTGGQIVRDRERFRGVPDSVGRLRNPRHRRHDLAPADGGGNRGPRGRTLCPSGGHVAPPYQGRRQVAAGCGA